MPTTSGDERPRNEQLPKIRSRIDTSLFGTGISPIAEGGSTHLRQEILHKIPDHTFSENGKQLGNHRGVGSFGVRRGVSETRVGSNKRDLQPNAIEILVNLPQGDPRLLDNSQ